MTPWTIAHQAPLSRDFPGKNTEADCHFQLQRSFLTQGLNPRLLHWQADSLPLSHQGPCYDALFTLNKKKKILSPKDKIIYSMSKEYSISWVVWDFFHTVLMPRGKKSTENDGRNLSWSKPPLLIREYTCSGICLIVSLVDSCEQENELH